ncbi:hypothetical protein BKI52_33095 [marine bacterium AO1-C]|nr:hypothetical protein BKI52_33095 [marine bacterium AO1-C]
MRFLVTAYKGGHPFRLTDLEHIQDGFAEIADALALAITGGGPTILTGANLEVTGNSWAITEGYVYDQNEIFAVPAQSGSLASGETAFLEVVTLEAQPPTTYEDNKTHMVHEDRIMRVVFSTQSAAGRVAYDSFKKPSDLASLSQDYYIFKTDINQLLIAATADIEDHANDIVAITADVEDHANQLVILNAAIAGFEAQFAAITLDIEDIQQDIAAAAKDIEDHTNDIIALTADAEKAARNLCPIGAITMTDEVSFFDANGYGNPGQPWEGWALCWGQAAGIPDLRTRFIYGAGIANAGLGSTGGQNQVTILEANIPAHNHSAGNGYNQVLRKFDNGDSNGTIQTGDSTVGEPFLTTSRDLATVGGNQPLDITPRHYVLAYAKKIAG